MSEKSVIIIGGGVAGLSAGCYARMNGYQATIFEMHTIPGGLCTSWRRKGYLMDGCIQYLTGSGPSASAYRMWEELGAVQERTFVNRGEFIRVEHTGGPPLVFYTNVDRLEAHLLEIAPEDGDRVRDFCDGIRLFTGFDMPLDWPATPQENLAFGRRMLPFLLPVLRWNRTTLRGFASRCRSPILREGLPHFFQPAHPDFPMTVVLMTLALMHNEDAGYPVGGSLKFALDIARRFTDLGGQIHYNSKVTGIVVENDKAVGIRLADGSLVYGDVVISAADGYDTIFTMLGGRYTSRKLRRYYEELPVSSPVIQVSVGVDMDLAAQPSHISFPLPQPETLAGKTYTRLVAKHYCFDPTAAPPGKSVVTVWLEADFDYWRRIYDARSVYDHVEDEVEEMVVEALDRRFPGLASHVEVTDVATPPTYERYTENWQGAISGWSITRKKMTMMMGKGMDKTLPGLENFYMIGQWVEPAGNVQLSAASGRDVFKLICQAHGKPFVTTRPEDE